jgi:hypothetical protein
MNWRTLIRSLPKGLTFREAASRLGQNYNSTRLAIHRYKYRAVDGRRFSQIVKRKIKVEAIDWRRSNIEIARELRCSRERVRQLRSSLGKPFVESRGRKPSKVTK